MPFLYLVNGSLSIVPVKARKPRAGATPKANAVKRAPVKFIPSAQADRYLVTDAVLAAWLAEDDAEKRAAMLPAAGSSTTSPIHPTEVTFLAMLDAYATRLPEGADASDGALFDIAHADAERGILVLAGSDAPADEPTLRSLFVRPAPVEAEPTPEVPAAVEPTPDEPAPSKSK